MSEVKLGRIGVVVYDVKSAMEHYTKVYGITNWSVETIEENNAVSYGRKEIKASWTSAIGSTSNITFELVQPLSGESPFMEHLRTKREGICFLRVITDPTRPSYVKRCYVGGGRSFYDTREYLGGFLLEMSTDMDERPEAVEGILPTQGIYHFGVLVHDVLKALPFYRDIFGIERFECKTWETGFGRLDDSMYRGEKVDHGYFTAQGHCADFGFEIIQCNHGPSHYNREFFDIRGPGIHHIFPWMVATQDYSTPVEAEAAWTRVIELMSDEGMSLCMGSPLRGGAAEFGYFDTFDNLGGYLIEGVIRREAPAEEFASPDWVIEY